ncbi:MAG TPA: filamentous hemagglutinin N-terminal domain-containing protein, partial [Terricaulis sp.]|nr:filamentous hemagglutinin N-terminal domain-containing protein [Terricaulis sp.]
MRLAIGAAALGFASGAHALPVAAPTLVVDSTPPDAPGPAAAYVAGGALGVVELNADRVFLDWNSFDIANGETVEFQREGSTSWIALNRVVGGGSTTIDGILRSIIDIDDGVIGGSIWVINPSGVAFGANAVVDVGGLLVATSAPTPADFVGGDLTGGGLLFTGPTTGVISTAPTARIVAQGGVVAFIAPTLQIGGEITATNPTGGIGQVMYASATSDYTVQFAVDPASPGGWDLIRYVVPGSLDPGLIDHDAVTTAGQVIFSAPRTVISAVMNLDGVVDATNVVATNTGVLITGSDTVEPLAQLSDASGVGYQLPGVDINAAGLSILTSGDVEASGGDLTLGEITAGGHLQVVARSLTFAGDVVLGDLLLVSTTFDDITIAADISSADYFYMSSAQDLVIQSGVTLRGDSDANGVTAFQALSVHAGRSVVAAADSLLAAGPDGAPFGNVTVASGWGGGGDVTVGRVQGQSFNINAPRDAANLLGGQVNIAGDIDVTDLYVIAGVNPGDVANIGVNANVNAAASATFIARNDINIAAGASISAGQAALVQADRDVSHLGVVVSGDYASIAAGRDISMGAGSIVRGDADGGGPLDPISSTVAYVQAARDLTMDAAALVAAGPDGAPSGGASVTAGGLWAGGFEGGGNLILGNVSAAYLNAGATRSADDAYGGSVSAIGNV